MKDRRYLLKTYRYCFVGEELVDWLNAGDYAKSREEAVGLGREMMAEHLIEHVASASGGGKEFSPLFLQFFSSPIFLFEFRFGDFC